MKAALHSLQLGTAWKKKKKKSRKERREGFVKLCKETLLLELPEFFTLA